MSWAAVSTDDHWAPGANAPSGALAAAGVGKSSFAEEARSADFVFVEVAPPREALRGRLSAWMDGAIERALETHGAPPPRPSPPHDRDAALADFVRRARSCGASGIALWLSSLAAIAAGPGEGTALDPGDSDTLRFWLGAASGDPLRLGVDPENRRLRVYLDPVTIESLLVEKKHDSAPPSSASHSFEAPSAIAGEDGHTERFDTDARDLGDEPDRTSVLPDVLDAAAARFESELIGSGVSEDVPAIALAPVDQADVSLSQSARSLAEDIGVGSDTDWLREALIELSTPSPAKVAVAPEPPVKEPAVRPLAARLPPHDDFPVDLDFHDDADLPPETKRHGYLDGTPVPSAGVPFIASITLVPDVEPEDVAEPTPEAVEPILPPPRRTKGEVRANLRTNHETLVPPLAPRISLDFDDSVPPPAAPPLRVVAAAPAPPPAPVAAPAPVAELDLDTRRKLEAHCRELDAANGPKPLAVVERLFQNAYIPLRAALDRGVDMPSLGETANEWAKSFEKSYADAFDALRVRSKRPTMVVDVPDVALRVARLHGARTTQLLLVDGLRYDLGDMVNDRLRAIVGQRAACAERFLMWAALPTTTAAQVELIGRGPSGLRDFTGEVQEDLIVAHGRKAAMIRRLKTGHRELLKLDMVASRLSEPSGADPATFPALADDVAQRLAQHFEGQKPRTLVMIFGDHGFALNRQQDGRVTAREGGSSPEEVLVPAFAWLVGAVH
jgi:hypothetical protein